MVGEAGVIRRAPSWGLEIGPAVQLYGAWTDGKTSFAVGAVSTGGSGVVLYKAPSSAWQTVYAPGSLPALRAVWSDGNHHAFMVGDAVSLATTILHASW